MENPFETLDKNGRMSATVMMVNDRVYVRDILLPKTPNADRRECNHVIHENNRLFVNGYEFDFETETWKRTFKSTIKDIFG